MTRHLLLPLLVVTTACGGAEPVGEEAPDQTSGDEARVWGWLTEDAFAALHEHTDAEPPPLLGEEIELAGSRAYLSLPEGDGPHPGIIVIHEWWGLNANIEHWSDRLAKLGYAALAVDLYGGQEATESEDAMRLMRAVDEEAGLAIVRAAATFLAEDPRTAGQPRAVIGWCFGGGWSLQTAIHVDGLDAVVMYYGQVVTDAGELAEIDAPLLGIFADRDQAIPPARVDAFDEALTGAGVDHRILRYDADHAFANPSGARYDHENAAAAWTEVQSFLAERLSPHAESPPAAE
jgi:carboxymethylenebutenolidase